MGDTSQKSNAKAVQSTRSHRAPTRGDAPAGYGRGTAFAAFGTLHAWAGNGAVSQLLGSGAPLPDDVRSEMEARFGADFSQVRIHDDARAHTDAAAHIAKAYTVRNDIVFSAHRFAPGTATGKRLLAHELAHVVQQSRGGSRPALDPGAAHEQAADSAANAVVTTQGAVPGVGGTGVGPAADLEDWYKKKKEALSNVTLDDVEGVAWKAAKTGLKTTAEVALGPGADISVDLLPAAVNDIKAAYTGEKNPNEPGVQEVLRDKTEEGIGVIKGVAVQGTELVDTLVWAGTEARDLKRDVVRKTAKAVGVDEDTAITVVEGGTKILGQVPGFQAVAVLDSLAETGDSMKQLGLVDDEGKASLTVPVSKGYDYLGDYVEDKLEEVGVQRQDNDMLFTPREKGELEGAIGTQVALAFTGGEEVKVALSVLGLLGGLRGVVETIRHNPNAFYKEPSFWSGILTMVLSVIGLKSLRAGSKIINIAIKGGAVLGAVPHLWQLYKDWDDPKLAADPEKQKRVLTQDWSNVIRALADALLAIAHAGAEGKPPPKGALPDGSVAPEVALPKKGGGGDPLGQGDTGTTTKGTATQADPLAKGDTGTGTKGTQGDPLTQGKEGTTAKATTVAGDESTGVNAPKDVPQAGDTGAKPQQEPQKTGTAKQQKSADELADKAVQGANKREQTAKRLENEANEARDRANARKTRADELRAEAEERLAALKKQQTDAQAKKDAATKARVDADAATDAKLKKKLDAAAARAKTDAEAAQRRLERTQKGADKADDRVKSADARAQDAEARAKQALADANDAREKAQKAQDKATEARNKANALKPKPDPDSIFDPAKEPAFAADPNANLPANKEPVVWVRTGKGKARGTYVAEGDTRFGKGDGFATPKSQADSYNFRPAGTDFAAQPIEPRVIGGRQVESSGAGSDKGGKFVSATAKDPAAVSTTSIRPDVAEAHAYNYNLDHGEVGIQRPLGSNAPGVDTITAQVTYDANGRPVKAKIFLNDVTTPTAEKGAKPSHAQWQQELAKALDPNAAPGQRLDFKNPELEAVIRKAAEDGDVHVRIVRVDFSPGGQGKVTINPAETWRLGPVPPPALLPHPVKPREGDDDEDKKP